jgi:mono/diheme cytochrome c family protein
MGPYRWAVIVGVLLIPTIFAVPRAVSQVAQKKNQDTQIERGRYLVEDVAMCGECHTPRNARGELEMDKWLDGATIWIMPIHPDLNWAERVPPLAGLPSLTDEEAERVLEKGTGPEGEVLRPPMHIYHMAPDDAKAIIAYLRSLPAGSE